jgi:DNA segregation ATPase FtsK/SpoIIIE-like protein
LLENDDIDPLFAEAAWLIVQSQIWFTSFLQRQIKLVYAWAVRLIGQMEAASFVAPFHCTKAYSANSLLNHF